MKSLLVYFVIAVNVLDVYSEREKCTKCVPKEKCQMYGDMSKREQDEWMETHPCQALEEEDVGPLFGFAPMAKGDLVCCPNSNIWGVENPTTPKANLGSRFGDEAYDDGTYKPDSRYDDGTYKPDSQDDDGTYRPNSRDGYNQDNLHKKQNTNMNGEDKGDGNDDTEDVEYEKQRYRWPNGRRTPRRPNNNNGRRQGGNANYQLPVFGADGMPILNNRPNYNGNMYSQPNAGSNSNDYNRPGNNFNDNGNNFDSRNDGFDPNPIPNRKQCSESVFPPDRESGCCGMDLASERMYGGVSNYMARPANSNYRRPNTQDSWWNPSRRFTRETPEELGISLDNRIAGGKRTDLYQFPWTVLLKATFDYGTKQSTFNCGGSLISSRYVLTAAHCVSDPTGRITNIDVYLAEYDKRTYPRDCVNSPEGRKCIDNILVKAEEVYAHPNYDDERLQGDVALIRLRENIPYTEFTRPICLPPINIDEPQYSNLRLAVAGWGRNGSVPSDIKQSTVVNLVPQRECARSYPSLTKQHVCAAGKTGEDTCKGDSGGPLMMLYEGKYYVSGVVSGKRADAPCGTSVPSLYTNVFQFLPWIQQTIRN
ncbi:hypothetical protein O0L34_g5008 [Tuta absoluta]|nr:hypothetical protein O0L34_g5008 [Tuta absoluta]